MRIGIIRIYIIVTTTDIPLMPMPSNSPGSATIWLAALLLAIWCVGMFGRGFWTPDEPREADIAWRMSWQSDKAVPLLAGEPFCEKPPLTYWIAALPIRLFGAQAWVARLPNLLYAIIGALCVGMLAQRSFGRTAALIGAAVIGTFLLSYQVEIWFATDAPLLACTAAALLGAYIGFHARTARERLGGYTLMHVALGVGFLSKSAAALIVPALTLLTLMAWERRWRELLRWEMYAGIVISAAMVLTWVGFVYAEPDGLAHLKVFFWNNLAGRFARVDAPAQLQYAAAHRNSPGKYFIELPMYLFPWTFAALAAARRAWLRRGTTEGREVRFAVCAFLPSLLLLSFAATARNVYLAPALPGAALLIAWWGKGIIHDAEPWDLRALRATSVLLLISTAVLALIAGAVRLDAGASLGVPALFIGASCLGVILAVLLALRAWNSAKRNIAMAQCALLAAYGALLLGPVAAIYGQVNRWQNLESVAREVRRDTMGSPLLLLTPDETTRAIVDMYVSTSVPIVAGPLDPTKMVEASQASADSAGYILALLPGRGPPQNPWLAQHLPGAKNALPAWADFSGLRSVKQYVLPNGRRYALLKSAAQ
jgi:4-amino-4-deoxy-L-arabinose transferase-like glycosyltransferase